MRTSDNPWPNFDFSVLGSAAFKEADVREELIAPLLHALGYGVSGENRILRAPSLVHPFVYLGCRKHKITIIPDYVLIRHGQPFCILDAKAPKVDITKGPAVEQAYSYAMHKDVRVGLYGLCNGKEFTLFHVSRYPSLLHFPLREIVRHAALLRHYLSSDGTAEGQLRRDFRPDLGLEVHKMGFTTDKNGKPYAHLFPLVKLLTAGRVAEDLFTISCVFPSADEGGFQHMVNFDFGTALFDDFLSQLPKQIRSKTRRALLTPPPNAVQFETSDPRVVGLCARIGTEPITNEDESYCPFIVEQFIP